MADITVRHVVTFGEATPLPADLRDGLALIAQRLEILGNDIMVKFADLAAAVEQARTVQQSAVALLQGLGAKLQEALDNGDDAQIQGLIDSLNTDTASLAAAVAANTSAENEPAPQPPPEPEPGPDVVPGPEPTPGEEPAPEPVPGEEPEPATPPATTEPLAAPPRQTAAGAATLPDGRVAHPAPPPEPSQAQRTVEADRTMAPPQGGTGGGRPGGSR